jgi:hypothetical protein
VTKYFLYEIFSSGTSEAEDEKIAWGSVQFHCECSVNQSRVTAPASYELPPTDTKKAHNPASSFPVGALAPVVFKTQPIILVVDIRLRPGEKKEYTFQDKIPPDVPPSYSGGFVKVPFEKLITYLQPVKNRNKLSFIISITGAPGTY